MSDDVKDIVDDLRESAVQTYEELSQATIDVLNRAADALEASEQAPAVDRETLAKWLGAYRGLGLDHYEQVDNLVASGILQDAAMLEREAEARGLEKAAEAAFRVTANMHGGFSNWLSRRAQQVREGN